MDVPAEDAVEWPESFMREFIDAIKALGEYKVTVKAGYQTTAQVQVLVVPETIGDQQ